MKLKKRDMRRVKVKHASSVRASISFTSALYEGLDDIAEQKKVSIAWVVRDAAEKYIAAQPFDVGAPRSDARRRERK